MSLAQVKWSLPAQDVAEAKAVDVLDNGAVVGSVDPSVTEFMTPTDLEPGDHLFTVVVRSRAGDAFDSDASNAAPINVPALPVKLTAVSDVSVTLVEAPAA